ncbi:Na+/H+ antiporter subunit E [Ruficoccus amylovorans]|uniref:Na+/H+ antiporter subunit E n=1 Tax=Ruficoccus amylovorans TaxID=1804625 RepID=A0A842HJC2_9BACT|nr:Na+/H+ antiporter subunit E [Ruficoccus amylovorans]MBC2595261.1 Na+/H+ antiporter subunit E [Ruficoccus amylovorans]
MKPAPWKTLLLVAAHLPRFLPYYVREMTLSNLRIARDAFRPRPRFKPGFVTISLAGYGPFQRWAAACLISMTPGTLSVDLPDASNALRVHALYLTDAEAVKTDLYRLLKKALGEPKKEEAV